jgi:hypothetical protein
MKRIFLLSVAVCLISFGINAQESDNVKVKPNELSFGFYNVFQLEGGNRIGIMYKRSFSKGALRIGSSFGVSSSTSENEDQYSQESKSHYFAPRLGYEFHQNIKNWQLFYGADLQYSYSYAHQKTDYINNSYQDNREITHKKNSIGVRPFVGVKYQINNWFSVTTETGLLAAYKTSKMTELQRYESSPDEKNITKTTGFSALLEPLGLVSLNFHF